MSASSICSLAFDIYRCTLFIHDIFLIVYFDPFKHLPILLFIYLYFLYCHHLIIQFVVYIKGLVHIFSNILQYPICLMFYCSTISEYVPYISCHNPHIYSHKLNYFLVMLKSDLSISFIAFLNFLVNNNFHIVRKRFLIFSLTYWFFWS